MAPNVIGKKLWAGLVVVAAGWFAACGSLAAATYYVDYEGGADANAGLSPESPLKHCPGDPQAADNATAVALQPGDTVVFKGGVTYRGSIQAKWSGQEGRPVTYDGNTAGTFGKGRAILAGSEPIAGWQRCASAEECGGNPNYKSICTAEIRGGAKDLTALSVGLVQDDRMLFPAQYPNPADPFYLGEESTYLRQDSGMTETSITDPRLERIGAGKLVGGYAFVTTEHNMVDYRPITAYDAGSKTITFRKLDRPPTTMYSIANSLSAVVLDRQGEYVFVEQPTAAGNHRVYVWPWEDKDPSKSTFTWVVRPLAIDLGRKRSHVTIQGLRIQDFRAAIRGYDVDGIVVRDNEITRIRQTGGGSAVAFVGVRNYVADGNHIHHCPDSNALQSRSGENVTYSNNRIEMVGRSPTRFYAIRRGRIIGNRIVDCRGVHSNPITIYLGSADILVARNEVHRSNIAITLQDVENVFVIDNVFTTDGATAVGLWPGRPHRRLFFLNNFIGGSERSIYVNTRTVEDSVFRNNIITGFQGFPIRGNNQFSHNIYVSSRRGLGEGEFVFADLEKILANPGEWDFRPRPDGPAVDMGADVSACYPKDLFPDFDFGKDFAGQPRPFGPRWDIGPYEVKYEPGALRDRPPIATGPESEPKLLAGQFTRIPDARPIVIPALSFTAQGGGEVAVMDRNTQAADDYVLRWGSEGHWLEWTVEDAAPGEYDVTLRYTCQFAASTQMMVNGEAARGLESFTCEPTGGWENWREVRLPHRVVLKQGRNLLRMTSLAGRGLNLDQITLSGPGGKTIPITAGSFTGQGGGNVEVRPSPRHGLFKFWNDEGHWLEWTIQDAAAGRYEVVLRYATLAISPRELRVNGEVVKGLESFELDRTDGWRYCRDVSLPVPVVLKAGRNVLRITSLGGGGLNLDEIRLIPVK